jgi:hypothetical protein
LFRRRPSKSAGKLSVGDHVQILVGLFSGRTGRVIRQSWFFLGKAWLVEFDDPKPLLAERMGVSERDLLLID